MTTLPLRIQSGATSHEGHVRDRNEDSFACLDQDGLWVVADGMGGHERGEWAAAALTRELGSGPLGRTFETACGEVAERIHRANRVIFEEADGRGVRMGSTIVTLLLRDRRFAVLWVGDSRAYLLRGGVLHQLSSDHSEVQELVERGLLQPEDAEGHPMSHVLARAVGVADGVEVDVIEDEVEPGDVFLLCSDGLHGYVAREDIARLLAQDSPQSISESLLCLTLDRGAPDNVTVIAVMVSEPTLVPHRVSADVP